MKIYIENYGCSANYNNGEILAGVLQKAGHEIIGRKEEKKADIIILNTCTVKIPTETKILRRIKEISKKQKLIISGCMPEVQSAEIKKARKDTSLIGIGNIERASEVVEALKKEGSKPVSLIGKNSWISNDMPNDRNMEINREINKGINNELNREIKLLLPKIRKNPVVSIIQISEGCNQKCAYCIVRIAKGALVSYPSDKIIEEARQSIRDGCKEIWLTSQDNAAYENGLPELIRKITSLDGEFMLRIGMMNPAHALPIADGLISAYKNKKVFKFLHIPVQSGNERVLEAMNRKHTAAQFRKLVLKFRKEIPEITLSTDIICGFPTETKKEFEDSLRLVNEIRPDILNISRFGARPGTAAAKMKQLHGNETKKRSQELTHLFSKISAEKNKKYLGKEFEVLIDEYGKNKNQLKNKNQFIGRTQNYLPVVVSGRFKLGQKAKVKITEARMHYLTGELITRK